MSKLLTGITGYEELIAIWWFGEIKELINGKWVITKKRTPKEHIRYLKWKKENE